jgi:hypothetical protein
VKYETVLSDPHGSNANPDPDPGVRSNADPYGSGSKNWSPLILSLYSTYSVTLGSSVKTYWSVDKQSNRPPLKVMDAEEILG